MQTTVAAEASTEAIKIFRRVKLRGKRKLGWATFSIDAKTAKIIPDFTSDDAKAVGSGVDALCSRLPDLQPRYAVYDYEFKTKDGRSTSKLYFFQYLPDNSTDTDRVTYAQSMKAFRSKLSGVTPSSSFSTKKEIKQMFGGTVAEDDDSEDEDEDFD